MLFKHCDGIIYRGVGSTFALVRQNRICTTEACMLFSYHLIISSGEWAKKLDSEQNPATKFNLWCALIGIPTVLQLAI